MEKPQSLDEFIHLAHSQGQRKVRIAIVGDPKIVPWTVRVEAYNRLNYDTYSSDETIFEELRNKLTTAGFDVTVVERQPYDGKIDPDLADVFSKRPPTGIRTGYKRKM